MSEDKAGRVITSRPVGKPGKAKGFIARVDTQWVWGRTREEAAINAFHIVAASLADFEPPASAKKYAEQKAAREAEWKVANGL